MKEIEDEENRITDRFPALNFDHLWKRAAAQTQHINMSEEVVKETLRTALPAMTPQDQGVDGVENRLKKLVHLCFRIPNDYVLHLHIRFEVGIPIYDQYIGALDKVYTDLKAHLNISHEAFEIIRVVAVPIMFDPHMKRNEYTLKSFALLMLLAKRNFHNNNDEAKKKYALHFVDIIMKGDYKKGHVKLNGLTLEKYELLFPLWIRVIVGEIFPE